MSENKVLHRSNLSKSRIINEENRWQKKYNELKNFKKEHGNCLVPNRYSQNKSLGFWVSTQRYQRKLMKNKAPSLMTPEREAKLDSLGFAWFTNDPNHTPWENNFFQLVQYIKKHGHDNLRAKKSKLGVWCSTQRFEYKRFMDGKYSKMTAERIKKLESIGFKWKKSNANNLEIRHNINQYPQTRSQDIVPSYPIRNMRKHNSQSLRSYHQQNFQKYQYTKSFIDYKEKDFRGHPSIPITNYGYLLPSCSYKVKNDSEREIQAAMDLLLFSKSVESNTLKLRQKQNIKKRYF